MKTWKTLWLLHEPPPPPTALQLAVAGLQEARILLLEQATLREHAQAMEQMLHGRIARLQNDIADLSAGDAADREKLFG